MPLGDLCSGEEPAILPQHGHSRRLEDASASLQHLHALAQGSFGIPRQFLQTNHTVAPWLDKSMLPARCVQVRASYLSSDEKALLVDSPRYLYAGHWSGLKSPALRFCCDMASD